MGSTVCFCSFCTQHEIARFSLSRPSLSLSLKPRQRLTPISSTEATVLATTVTVLATTDTVSHGVYYGKREAEAEPKAEAEPYYYGGYGYGLGLRTYGLGYG